MNDGYDKIALYDAPCRRCRGWRCSARCSGVSGPAEGLADVHTLNPSSRTFPEVTDRPLGQTLRERELIVLAPCFQSTHLLRVDEEKLPIFITVCLSESSDSSYRHWSSRMLSFIRELFFHRSQKTLKCL